VDYRKYDVKVTVIIHQKGGYWNCAIRIIWILGSLTAWGILLRTVGQIWVFLRVNFYVDEVTLRHVNIQGRNTTISPFITAPKIAGIHWRSYV